MKTKIINFDLFDFRLEGAHIVCPGSGVAATERRCNIPVHVAEDEASTWSRKVLGQGQ